MDAEEFRRIGYMVVDWLADYRANIAQYPVQAQVQPGQIRAQLPATPPEQPQSFEAILHDMEQIIMPGLTHWQHPRFFGYFPANADPAAVLGDLLSSGLGVLGLAWQSSPALTEVEEVVSDWMRQMVGLSDAWSGVIQQSASTSSLVSLLCARERSSDFALARGGLQSVARPLIVYTSEQSHSSVLKAALLAGFGRDNVRSIGTDASYALDPQQLRAAIEQDLAAGVQPCAIVATTGTTTATAIDPLGAIASIAQEYGIWLHVDAAMAGSAMILPECRWMWHGIEGADTLVLNPHKWLGAQFDCSLYYVRDPEVLIRVMSTNPSYLQSSVDDQVKNLRDWGLPLGRRFRALKLWCLIREQGVASLQARLRRDIANARWLAEQVQAAPHWRVLAPVPLQTVCVLHEPPGLAGEELDQHTLAWCQQINQSGAAYLTPAILNGRWMVRVSVGATPTEHEHVAALWQTMQAAVAEVAPSQ